MDVMDPQRMLFCPRMDGAKPRTLARNTVVRGIPFKQGSVYRAFKTPHFAWIVFQEDARTVDGKEPHRRVFQC